MCSNHHLEFDDWKFFIRFQLEVGSSLFSFVLPIDGN